jgi:hypothetical protein
MSQHFAPDDEAVDRARRDKYAKKEEQELADIYNID